MKIKHILAALTLCAATAAGATDVAQLRIYVNPGHGSWTGGDRAMATVKHGGFSSSNTDTCGFFESNTNLWKCLGLFQQLREYGLTFDDTKNLDNPNPARRGAAMDLSNNIVMSRVKNGPFPHSTELANAYNRDLYEICCEVERNNFDFFISVHSNAAQDTETNYPSFWVRGKDRTARVPGSDDAARLIWPYAFADEHQQWNMFSMTNPALYYDVDFWDGVEVTGSSAWIDGKYYPGYYGVLRHGVKGFLLEGYFHTHQPARHRAMQPAVCRHEGLCYARGIAALFEIPQEPTGELYGIVRDGHMKFTHNYYHGAPGTPDEYKPINNAEVTLYRDGNEVRKFTTDDEYNGAFVFPGLEPGQYTIKVSADGYLEAEDQYCGPFTIEAAKTVYPRVFLTSEDYDPSDDLFYDYPDPLRKMDIDIPGIYKFAQTHKDKGPSYVKNKTVKRLIERDEFLYILSMDEEGLPSISVLKEATATSAAQVSVTGCEGSLRNLSDIQLTSDGVLLGIAMDVCQADDSKVNPGESRGQCTVYRWERNDDKKLPQGDPQVWFTTQTAGGFDRAATGRTMAYTGTFQEGRMIVSSEDQGGSGAVAFTVIDVAAGAKGAETTLAKPEHADYLNAASLGEYTITTSPFASGTFVIQGPGAEAREYSTDGMELVATVPAETVSAASQQAGFFRMARHSFMVAPRNSADGKNTGLVLLDITDGIAQARVIETNCELPETEGVTAATGRCGTKTDIDGRITEWWIDLYLIRKNGSVCRFSTRKVTQPAGLDNITVDSDAPVEYYNLQGIRVDNPSRGIYIRRQGSKATKVLLR